MTDSDTPTALLAAEFLSEVREQFPKFRIWRETVPGRVRYVARSLSPGQNPHTVVTSDPAELRAALGGTPAQRDGHQER